jgi:hypothetical protein
MRNKPMPAKKDNKRKPRTLWLLDDDYEILKALAAKDNRTFSSYCETLLLRNLQRKGETDATPTGL